MLHKQSIIITYKHVYVGFATNTCAVEWQYYLHKNATLGVLKVELN